MRFRIERVDGVAMAGALAELDRVHFCPAARIDTKVGWWWLAWCEEEVAGFCGLYRSFQWENTGYLCRAAVNEKFRGHGLQRRLITVRLRQARRNGWKWVVTDTLDNPHSARNLIKAGFLPYHPMKPWGTKQSTYWIKEL